MKKIEIKKFKILYPTYNEFETNVVDKLKILGKQMSGSDELPAYLDDNKSLYKLETIYAFLYNKYQLFNANNEDSVQHNLMVNALMHTLPALYAKSKMLTPEALDLLDPAKLLSTIERRYNEDPDNKYASTETGYSSTPNAINKLGDWQISSIKEKNMINRKDATIRIKETSNLIDKLKELSKVEFSGWVYDFVNTIEISSLWTLYEDEYEIVVMGCGIENTASLQLSDPSTEGYDVYDVQKNVNEKNKILIGEIKADIPLLSDRILANEQNIIRHDNEIGVNHQNISNNTTGIATINTKIKKRIVSGVVSQYLQEIMDSMKDGKNPYIMQEETNGAIKVRNIVDVDVTNKKVLIIFISSNGGIATSNYYNATLTTRWSELFI